MAWTECLDGNVISIGNHLFPAEFFDGESNSQAARYPPGEGRVHPFSGVQPFAGHANPSLGRVPLAVAWWCRRLIADCDTDDRELRAWVQFQAAAAATAGPLAQLWISTGVKFYSLINASSSWGAIFNTWPLLGKSITGRIFFSSLLNRIIYQTKKFSR